jgi:hypothetical protein
VKKGENAGCAVMKIESDGDGEDDEQQAPEEVEIDSIVEESADGESSMCGMCVWAMNAGGSTIIEESCRFFRIAESCKFEGSPDFLLCTIHSTLYKTFLINCKEI